ncbi:MAG: thiol reductant ABC exporter subunit CydC [Patulibacter sp.]|nr:thiol reductant ABC exporter subunit CydC [Patulibacter sp.]
MIAAIRRALALATDDERRRLRLASLVGIVAGAAGTALLALSGYLIAEAAGQPPVLSLGIAIVGVRGFGILRAAARYLERLVGHDATFRILARLRAAAFAGIAARPAAAGVGAVDQLVADVDRVQDAYLRAITPLAVASAVGLGGLAVAALILPAAAAVLAGVLLAGAVALPARAAGLARAASSRRGPLRADLVRDVTTALDAAPELVVAGLADDQIDRVRASGAALATVERSEGRATALVAAAATAIGGLGAAAALAVALPAAESGRLDPVLVGLLALLVLGVGESIAPLPAAARELRGTADAVDRVSALLARNGTCPTPAPAPGAAPTVPRPADARGDGSGLCLDRVAVRRGGRPVLRDVSLAILPGERVALVGPSGAGKSTVGELLVGFLPSTDVAGSATLDGTPLPALDGIALRERVLHVPQDPYVFDADVAANLRLARPDADERQLVAALRAVGAGRWFDGLADGLATRVGERGRALSGGERQRLGLARVWLRCTAHDAGRRPDGGPSTDAGSPSGRVVAPPRFLVLDEPVSHLPPAEGRAVLADLLAATPDAGALLIAHRSEEAALADRTVHLGADGRLRGSTDAPGPLPAVD